MATYTVIQDIEAEDKLLGPLTLRQFIYACIMVGSLFLAYLVGKAQVFLALPFIVPAAVFGFLAAPFKKDQPTETWAVAKIRFLFKPRKRLWDQSGQKELVEVTVPKKEVVNYTDGLSQHDVRHRLYALASTIDSRGWAIKTDASVHGMAMPAVISGGTDENSDRLTGGVALPSAVPNFDQTGAMPVDILDETAGVAQNFDKLIATAEQTHRQQIIERLNSADSTAVAAPASSTSSTSNSWFQPQAGTPPIQDDLAAAAPTAPTPQINPADEAALIAELDAKKIPDYDTTPKNMKVIQPLGSKQAAKPPRPVASSANTQKPVAKPNPKPAEAAVTANPDPAILNLSRNDDLDIATIARQANKQSNSDEVVISLH